MHKDERATVVWFFVLPLTIHTATENAKYLTSVLYEENPVCLSRGAESFFCR